MIVLDFSHRGKECTSLQFPVIRKRVQFQSLWIVERMHEYRIFRCREERTVLECTVTGGF